MSEVWGDPNKNIQKYEICNKEKCAEVLEVVSSTFTTGFSLKFSRNMYIEMNVMYSACIQCTI